MKKDLNLPIPNELGDAMARARQRAEELAGVGIELHFLVNDLTKKITVEARDRAGNLLKVITPSVALELLSGRDEQSQTTV